MARERLEILRSIGVDAFLLDKGVNVNNVTVLGKGTNSIVVKGLFKRRLVVIKVLRQDASRESLRFEAEVLEALRDKEIAPELILYGDWFVIEEYIMGELLRDFVREDVYNYSRLEISMFLETLFKKAFYLDNMNIDHGELTRPEKHVIVLDTLDSRIIDFESASLTRTPKNLTSLYQYFFIRSPASGYLRAVFNIRNIDSIIHILSKYKKKRDEEAFKEVISTFKGTSVEKLK